MSTKNFSTLESVKEVSNKAKESVKATTLAYKKEVSSPFALIKAYKNYSEFSDFLSFMDISKSAFTIEFLYSWNVAFKDEESGNITIYAPCTKARQEKASEEEKATFKLIRGTLCAPIAFTISQFKKTLDFICRVKTKEMKEQTNEYQEKRRKREEKIAKREARLAKQGNERTEFALYIKRQKVRDELLKKEENLSLTYTELESKITEILNNPA